MAVSHNSNVLIDFLLQAVPYFYRSKSIGLVHMNKHAQFQFYCTAPGSQRLFFLNS